MAGSVMGTLSKLSEKARLYEEIRICPSDTGEEI